MFSVILAVVLLYVLCSAAASLILLLPAMVAAESLPGCPLAVARRFWITLTLLPPVCGIILSLAAFASLGGDIAATPHQDRVRLHLCVARFATLPDAPFRFRLYALLALAMVLFALVRFAWGAVTSWRAQQLADHLQTEPQPGAPPEAEVVSVTADEADCFSIGLDRPLVVMTQPLEKTLSEQERRAVIAHEQCHVRHQDVALELLLRLATDALLWLPSTHYYLGSCRAAIERACDAAAAEQTSPDWLISALKKMAEVKRARHVRLRGDLAPLRPTFPGYASPDSRIAALAGERYLSLALPLRVILTIEGALLLTALLWLRGPLHDTLYCLAEALLGVV